MLSMSSGELSQGEQVFLFTVEVECLTECLTEIVCLFLPDSVRIEIVSISFSVVRACVYCYKKKYHEGCIIKNVYLVTSLSRCEDF